MPASAPKLTLADYETLAALRHTLRRFLRFSEEAAQRAGIPPQQHQALLALKGFGGRRDHVSVGDLAQWLHLRHHSAVGLVDRLVQRGMVRRRPSPADRRRVDLELTARGETLIARLSAAHLDELRHIGPELKRVLQAMDRR